MFGRLRLRPAEIDRLTEVELVLCLDDDTERRRPADGGRPVGAGDVREYARAWRSQTAAQRLARARGGG